MAEQKFVIRKLESKDYFCDYLELLRQLTECREMNFKMFENIVDNIPENTRIYVMYDEENLDKVIASATLLLEQKIIRSGRKVGHIEDVVVDKDYRKYGLGKALIHKLMKVAKEEDCYKVILDCDEQLENFYKRCGFEVKGTQMAKYF